MALKRTQEEILEKIKTLENTGEDFLGFQRGDLINFLDYELAKPYLKEGVTKEEWDEVKDTDKDPVDVIKDYMEFAWMKANDCRGISAMRSLHHMKIWLWLAGEDEFLQEWDGFESYEYYGKPQLIAICEKYDIDWKQYDDGVRTNTDS